ncbi:MAG TPA: hypothetical protein GX505_10405 [Clostridiales bacterium]|nr:hypothetical protein [Clostridiales bacterium]
MRMIFLDFYRVMKSKWFYIALATSAVSLWMNLGSDSYWILHGGTMDPMEMLAKALSGPGSALSLPLLASLPYSANAYQELSSGAARMAMFRCGRAAYMISKLLSVVCAAAYSQALGVLLFTGVMLAIAPGTGSSFPAHMLISRLLSATVFSIIGGTGALLSEDTVSAIAVPTAVSFALSMLSARFFIGVRFINPLSWLSGEADIILFLCIFILAMAALYSVVLKKVMLHYV